MVMGQLAVAFGYNKELLMAQLYMQHLQKLGSVWCLLMSYWIVPNTAQPMYSMRAADYKLYYHLRSIYWNGFVTTNGCFWVQQGTLLAQVYKQHFTKPGICMVPTDAPPDCAQYSPYNLQPW